jgi:hypothetical protein
MASTHTHQPATDIVTVAPVVTSATTSTSVATASAAGTTTAGLPAAIQANQPPTVNLPAWPPGFVPVHLLDYRGSHPKAGQVTATPGAVQELDTSTSYQATFGPAAPPAAQLASELTIASEWTALRIKVETFLTYVKSFEAITWKTALTDLDRLDGIFQVILAQNPALVAGFPEIAKLLDVQKAIGQRGAATRVRKAKANAKTTANSASAAGPATSTAPTVGATPAAAAASAAAGTGTTAH